VAHCLNIDRVAKATDYYGWVQGMYLAKDDCGIAIRLLNGFEYETQSRKLWQKLCAGAELVIDVGAHTGLYSLEARRAGAKEVLSIEPYHLNYARMLMNLRHSGFDTKSVVFCAASDRDGVENFSVDTPAYYCSSGGKLGADEFSIPYPVITKRIDSLLKEEHHHKVRAVKIDTEGHVANVLRGMPKILEHRPDLILECIEEGLTEILAPLGYKFFVIDERTGLSPISALRPDRQFTFNSPNRYATVREVE